MQPFISGPILALIGYFLYQSTEFYLRRRRFEKIHGCQPAAKLPQIDRILGVDIFVQNLRYFNKKCLMPRLKQRFEQTGNTYSVTLAGNTMIYTIEPENIKAVFSTQFDDFDVGWQRRRAMAPTMGEFLLNADGARWHHYRAMLRPAFSRRQISAFGTFKHDIDDLLCAIPRDRSTVDLSPLFYKLALALGTSLLFDETMSSLNPEFKTSSEDFIRAFHTVNRGAELRVRMGLLLPLMPRNRLYDDANKFLHNYADAFVQKALEYRKTWDSGDTDNSERTDERYVFLREIAKENADPVRLRDHLLGMLLAGSETTTSLLTSCLSILSHRRTLWAELRAEVLEMQDQEPNYERVKALTKLNYFINEGTLLSSFEGIKCRFADLSSPPSLPDHPYVQSSRKQRHDASDRRRARWQIKSLHTQK